MTVTDGLVSRYKFEESGDTSTFTDVENGYDLSVSDSSGISYTSDSDRGTVISLDGTAYASANHAEHTLGSWTITGWFKTSNTQQGILDNRQSSGGKTSNYGLNDNNADIGGAFYDSADGEWVTARSSTATYADGVWHHIAITYDNSADTLTTYLDGSQIAQTTNASNPYQDTTNETIIGHDPSGAVSNFTGRLDDFRIYNRELSSSEVGIVSEDGLEAHYTFEDTSDTSTVRDYTYNGNDATVNGGSYKTVNPLVGDASYEFTGGTQYLSISDSPYVSSDTKSTISFSVWFKPKQTGHQTLLDKRYEYSIFFDRGGNQDINFGTYGNNIYAGADSLSLDEWHHVVVNWNIGNWVSIWVDNTKYVDQASYTDSTSATSNPLEIGHQYTNGAGHQLIGTVEDVRILNRSLTSGEVDVLHGFPLYNGLLYHDNESITGTNNGVSTSTQSAIDDTAFKFDASNSEYIGTGLTSTELNSNGDTSLSWAGWVDWSNTSSKTAFFGNDDDGNKGKVVLYADPSNDRVRFSVHNTSGGTTNFDFSSIPSELSSGGWCHTAITYDESTGEAILYIDGSKYDTITKSATPNLSDEKIVYGAFDNWKGLIKIPFSGLMDDVRFYNRTLSPSEVDSLSTRDTTTITATVTPTGASVTTKQATLIGQTRWSSTEDWDNSVSESDVSHSKDTVTLGEGQLFADGFEDGSATDWTLSNNTSVVSDYAHGTYSLHSNYNGGAGAYAKKTVESGGGKPEYVEWYFRETSSDSWGHGVRLFNSNGGEELAVATNNPQIDVYDGTGWNGSVDSGYGYKEFYRVKVLFDWANGTFDVEYEEPSTGTVHTYTGFSLASGVDIQDFEVWNYSGQQWDNGNCRFWIDDIDITTSSATSGSLTTAAKTITDAKPDISATGYTLNDGSIDVTVTGSPNSSTPESQTVTLDGSTAYDLSWSESHSEFSVKLSLSIPSSTSTKPVFDHLTVEVQKKKSVTAQATVVQVNGSSTSSSGQNLSVRDGNTAVFEVSTMGRAANLSITTSPDVVSTPISSRSAESTSFVESVANVAATPISAKSAPINVGVTIDATTQAISSSPAEAYAEGLVINPPSTKVSTSALTSHPTMYVTVPSETATADGSGVVSTPRIDYTAPADVSLAEGIGSTATMGNGALGGSPASVSYNPLTASIRSASRSWSEPTEMSPSALTPSIGIGVPVKPTKSEVVPKSPSLRMSASGETIDLSAKSHISNVTLSQTVDSVPVPVTGTTLSGIGRTGTDPQSKKAHPSTLPSTASVTTSTNGDADAASVTVSSKTATVTLTVTSNANTADVDTVSSESSTTTSVTSTASTAGASATDAVGDIHRTTLVQGSVEGVTATPLTGLPDTEAATIASLAGLTPTPRTVNPYTTTTVGAEPSVAVGVGSEPTAGLTIVPSVAEVVSSTLEGGVYTSVAAGKPASMTVTTVGTGHSHTTAGSTSKASGSAKTSSTVARSDVEAETASASTATTSGSHHITVRATVATAGVSPVVASVVSETTSEVSPTTVQTTGMIGEKTIGGRYARVGGSSATASQDGRTDADVSSSRRDASTDDSSSEVN